MQPLLLCILDGVGLTNETRGNAFFKANKPNFDYLWNNYPHSKLIASGEAVGLPTGQMGNSEVGHLNIGAGRIVYQPLELINSKVATGEIYQNKEILSVMNHTKKNNSKLHFFGLLSDGGVHSNINHLFALMDMCKKEGITNVYYHVFLDGRDTFPDSGITYLTMLDEEIKRINLGSVATISGRYYAMDRDNRWDRVELAYKAITSGIGEEYSNYKDMITDSYNKGVYDEFVIPTVIDKKGIVEANDGLIVFNYRPDRLRELFYALTNPNFKEFERPFINNLKLVTMMSVSDDVITTNAFNLDRLTNTLGDYLSSLDKTQLRIAETEKYAHVTYFFDGGVDKELKGCKRILVPSPKVATYDLQPEMSANQISEDLLKEMANYDVIILNFANGDMVGHTGVMEAAVKAVETLDINLGKIINKIKELNGTLLVTADHGNCEQMLDSNGNPFTAHTTNPVPFIIMNKDYELLDGKLGDIAPTILYLLGLPIPKEMTGQVLIKH